MGYFASFARKQITYACSFVFCLFCFSRGDCNKPMVLEYCERAHQNRRKVLVPLLNDQNTGGHLLRLFSSQAILFRGWKLQQLCLSRWRDPPPPWNPRKKDRKLWNLPIFKHSIFNREVYQCFSGGGGFSRDVFSTGRISFGIKVSRGKLSKKNLTQGELARTCIQNLFCLSYFFFGEPMYTRRYLRRITWNYHQEKFFMRETFHWRGGGGFPRNISSQGWLLHDLYKEKNYSFFKWKYAKNYFSGGIVSKKFSEGIHCEDGIFQG